MRWLPVLALMISPLVSAVTLDELQQRFTGQPVVRAHFEQVGRLRICRSRCARRAKC